MKVKLENVRLSFPDLFEATQYQGKGPFNYGASFILSPKHPAAALIEAAIRQVATEKWKDRAPQIVSASRANPQKFCFLSGDLKEYDGYKGNMVLSAKREKSKGPPLVFDHRATPAQPGQPGCPYAGCYVNATVDLWAQDNEWGKAIRATLLGVQFRADGDAFAAGAAPDPSDFDDLSSQGDGAAPPAPAAAGGDPWATGAVGADLT